MGRMNDAAKRKVVELRMAGLSFRRIKAVLELEDIKVSVQTVYSFLRELQGRPPGRVQPVEARLSTPTVNMQHRASGSQESGSPTQNQTREATQYTRVENNTQTKEQSGTSAEKDNGDRKDNEIKIVSVTSLASNMRRRVTSSPANNPVLAAGKKLLDRALSQKKSLHQVSSSLKKDALSVQGSNLRTAVLQRARSYDVRAEKSGLEPGGSGASRKFTFPRPAARSPGLPQVGVRFPSQASAPLATPGKPLTHHPNSGGLGRNERNPSPQRTAQYSKTTLQDQIQSLGVEVQSLGLAVNLLREQQGRMEKEQAEQTSIQKQILKTLQLLASRSEPCSIGQQQNQRPTPPPPPSSFSQDSFSFEQNSFPSCSQAGYSSLENLESVEPFRLSPPGLNGFLGCSSSGGGGDSLPLTHPPASYQQPSAQTLLPPYTQAFSGFAQPTTHMKSTGFQNNQPTLPDGVSTQTQVTSVALSQDRQHGTIKLEEP